MPSDRVASVNSISRDNRRAADPKVSGGERGVGIDYVDLNLVRLALDGDV